MGNDSLNYSNLKFLFYIYVYVFICNTRPHKLLSFYLYRVKIKIMIMISDLLHFLFFLSIDVSFPLVVSLRISSVI